MESSELKTIIEKSGLSAYRIEKDLKIPNGTLNQVIKGTKKLPEKYEEPLRGLGGSVPDIKYLDERGNFLEPSLIDNIAELSGIDNPISKEVKPTIEEVPEPEEVKGQSLLQPFLETVGNIIASEKAKKQVKRPDMSIAYLL